MASAVPAELRTAVRALQLSVQQSRPRNVVCFSLRFIHDERSDNASMGHALHALPFLLRHPDAFRSMACTVFCGTKNVQGVLCDRKGLREVVRASMASVTGCPNPSASQPPPPSSRKQSETVSAATSEDGRGDALAVAWQLDVIEATLREHLKTLDLLDFECFVVTLRIYLSCWVVILWVMDMLADAGGSFSELLALLKRQKSPSYWEQMPHPLRQENFAVEDAQNLTKLLQNALPVNEDVNMLCQHVVRGYLAAAAVAAPTP